MKPRRVLGVDFSGASDAGRKIWIAECKRGRGNRLILVDLVRACDLDRSGIDPATAIAALAEFIVKEPDTIAGCDFPFSLPKQHVGKAGWGPFASRFLRRFPDPDAFRNWAMRLADGRELRRPCDRAAKTPFNSYNLRIYRQTWCGIAYLLNPLALSGRAVVHPFHPLPKQPHPIIVEACPACLLKRIGFYPSYKGRTGAHRLERKAILAKLMSLGLLTAPLPAVARVLLDNAGGDALDAVIAAIATAHADIARQPTPDERTEGIIYG